MKPIQISRNEAMKLLLRKSEANTESWLDKVFKGWPWNWMDWLGD